MTELKNTIKNANIPLRIVIVITICVLVAGITVAMYITLKRFDSYDKYDIKTREIIKLTKEYVLDKEILEPMHITVNKLIVDGYLKADNNKGEVINPRNEKTVLNCNTVFIDFLDNETEVTFNEEKDCDLMQSELIDTKIEGLVWGEEVESDSLVESDIILSIVGETKCNNVTWFIDGVELAEYRNAISLPITYKEHVKETYSARCETEKGVKVLKFILRTERVEGNQLEIIE